VRFVAARRVAAVAALLAATVIGACREPVAETRPRARARSEAPTPAGEGWALPERDTWPTARWRASTPEAQEIDRERLSAAEHAMRSR
jgi:hypothetical protein